jgi:hypothetical protein
VFLLSLYAVLVRKRSLNLYLFSVLRTGTKQHAPDNKEVYSLSITADRIQLPDGRYIAYREEGVSASLARHSILVIHSFVSSRLAGNIFERYQHV